MKKRLLLVSMILVMALLAALALKVVIPVWRQPPIRPQAFAALAPAAPLAYVECAGLKTLLAQLRRSAAYQAFLQSELGKQMQQTEWWQAVVSSLEQLRQSLIIDPLRVIGVDVALAVYPAATGETLPGVMLIGKIDRTARLAERLLSLIANVNKQIGVTFHQEYQHFLIYRIAQPEMLCPLYYTIAGDLGIIATSLPLLQATVRAAIGEETRPAKPTPFRQALQALPANRVATCYLDPGAIVAELQQNPWLRSLDIPATNNGTLAGELPLAILNLESPLDQITLRLELFAAADLTGAAAARSKNQAPLVSLPANVPIILALDQKKLTPFLQHWQRVFPQWELAWLVQMFAQTQTIFGDVLECQASNMLAGTVYALPELVCLLETPRPEQARALLDATVQNVLDQQLPALAQQTFVKRSTELYRNTQISTVQFMFQEIFNYAITAEGNRSSPKAYTVLATTGRGVKSRLAGLQAQPTESPYALKPLQAEEAFLGLLRNPGLAELIQKFSQANTFALLYPRQTHAPLYQNLPRLIQFLQPLPPILLGGGTQGAGVYLELRFPNQTDSQ